MARPDLQRLYEELSNSGFAFLSKGEHDINDIYRAVELHYGTLCDDGYLCVENCSGGHQQPEWQHVVRKALNTLRGRTMRKGPTRGSWLKV